jgi:predicted house-cleaning noncanonical NTP pyrophosphatase (MazG superfamily)
VKFRARNVHRLREFPQDVIRVIAGSRRAVIHRLAPAAIELSTAGGVYAHSYPQAIHKVPGVVCRWPRQLVFALGSSMRLTKAKVLYLGGGPMEIRSAQKIALDPGRSKNTNTNDVTLGFGLLGSEVAKAFDAWSNGRTDMAEELAAIAIFLLRLAEMVDTDLQEVVEAYLDLSRSRVHGQPPNGVPVNDPAVAETVAMNQGKLVRDKIPQIIRSKGQEPIIYIADTEEYSIRLRDKLREEVEEYLASDNDREELADILEVLYALARQAGTDQQQLENLRAAKAERRGGFTDRIIWFRNQHEPVARDTRMAAAKL